MDETTTKALTSTKEHLINDRLASKLSLYDDDVAFKIFWFGLCNCSQSVFITKGRFVRIELYTRDTGGRSVQQTGFETILHEIFILY